MITIKDVEYSLIHDSQTLTILKGVNLQVSAGQVVSLVGPSGSGKSTLLALIAGVEAATGGMVRVNGYDFNGRSADDLARFRRRNIGIVFQDFHLVSTLTALENVALPLTLAGTKNASQQAEEMLERVGLSHRLSHRPRELSGGEKQRVAIARAFVTRPGLILADEPTGNLDQDTSQRIMDLLFDMVQRWKTTFFLVTHDNELVGRMDRQFRLSQGGVVQEIEGGDR
ncbi:MAG: ABC transporter ATP-binding protein [Magnetococcales bacterium]|nr:ABC transporter ATP-binding protein [Magnetococcales bacterium]